MQGYRLQRAGNHSGDLSTLADSEQEALEEGLTRSLKLNFSERTTATHGPDWQKAELGYMKYEDMLDERPDRDEVVAYLLENARFMKL